MNPKLSNLLHVFEKNEYRHLRDSMPKIKEQDFTKSAVYEEVVYVYKQLGGMSDLAPFTYPYWDLEFESVAIKFDTEEHFNRYRGATLRSDFYKDKSFFSLENYKRYCRQYEPECLKTSRSITKWSDSESDRLFGRSQEPGDLSLTGSSKWKQLAYVDFLQDVSAYILKINLVRLSIYENLMVNNKLVRLDQLLLTKSAANEKVISSFLKRKLEEK